MNVRRLAAVSVAAMACLALAGPAAADPAFIIDQRQCVDVNPTQEYCYERRFVFHITETGSGNMISGFGVLLGRESYSSPGCRTVTTDRRTGDHIVRRDGNLQTYGYVLRESFRIDCGGAQVFCQGTTVFNQVNGEVRVTRAETRCRP